ncbi:tyrosine-type recombinase/integrase [uncultured Gemella sp.]|uniref:site-specific integrase n=1 Tax=uncultured Gemella sp. TaxID=254352 RepID=UPI0028D391FA|nr:tyrosine-type recombinase/integrase [uncultured Gemella sp.]
MIKQYTKKSDRKKYYTVHIYLGKDEITGKDRYTTRRGFKTKKEALLCEAKIKTEIATNGLLNTDVTTFKEIYELWYEGYQHTIKESTLVVNSYVFKLLLDKLEHVQLKKITLPFCQKIITNYSKKFSLSTLKKIKIYGGMIFDYAVKMKVIYSNPMKDVLLPKKQVDITSNDKDLYYSKDELNHFLKLVDSTNDIKLSAMFRVLAYTGIRKGELQALEWSDIDFTNNTININKTLAISSEYKIKVQTPKSKSSIRKISIDEETKLILKRWKAKQRELFFSLGTRVKKNQLCFTNDITNDYLYLNFTNDKLSKICKKHKFKEIKIHGFRHTHCSLLFESGFTIQEVQDRLGHSDLKTTMSVYAHVTEKQRDNMADKFAKFMAL